MGTEEEEAPAPKEDTTAFIPFKEFLEEYPIGTRQKVSGYYEVDTSVPASRSDRFPKCTPTLRLYCQECDGFRNFEGKWQHNRYCSSPFDDFLIYKCRDCNKQEKRFCLYATPLEIKNGEMIKLGEYPSLHIKLPTNLSKLFGDDSRNFINGLKCERQGLGIGAYSYYRRVLENQKNQLLGEVLKVSRKLSVKDEMIQTIERAISETRFSKAIDMVKDSLPESLLVDGQNPFKLLHKVLSIGIHNVKFRSF